MLIHWKYVPHFICSDDEAGFRMKVGYTIEGVCIVWLDTPSHIINLCSPTFYISTGLWKIIIELEACSKTGIKMNLCFTRDSSNEKRKLTVPYNWQRTARGPVCLGFIFIFSKLQICAKGLLPYPTKVYPYDNMEIVDGVSQGTTTAQRYSTT